jgi:hypothetical protein
MIGTNYFHFIRCSPQLIDLPIKDYPNVTIRPKINSCLNLFNEFWGPLLRFSSNTGEIKTGR